MTIAIKVKNLKVRSLDLDFNEISWTVENTSVDILDYTFQVIRSESPEGPFMVLSEPFFDRYMFIDNAILVGDKWRTYYYRLRICNIRTGESVETDSAAKEPEPDLYALEIRRHIQVLFREHAGRRMWLLPNRQSGQRCECWAPRLGQKTRSGCKTCYDTSYVRGYYYPIETFGQIDPSPKASQTSNVGPMQQTNTTGRFPAYPPMKPDDILVELENRRWKVTKVTCTEKARAAIHQEVELHEIPPSDMEYAIPLVLEQATKDLWATPLRNYVNPHNLENLQGWDNIFDLFRSR